MGTWGDAPWDNDTALDWLSPVLSDKLAVSLRKALASRDPAAVRGAAWLARRLAPAWVLHREALLRFSVEGLERIAAPAATRELEASREALSSAVERRLEIEREAAEREERRRRIQELQQAAFTDKAAGRFEEAVRKAEEALEHASEADGLELMQALGTCGVMRLGTGDLEGAADQFRRATCGIHPIVSRHARGLLVDVLHRLDRQHEAWAALEMWKQLLPGETCGSEVDLLVEAGRLDEARAVAARMASEAEAHFGRGVWHLAEADLAIRADAPADALRHLEAAGSELDAALASEKERSELHALPAMVEQQRLKRDLLAVLAQGANPGDALARCRALTSGSLRITLLEIVVRIHRARGEMDDAVALIDELLAEKLEPLTRRRLLEARRELDAAAGRG